MFDYFLKFAFLATSAEPVSIQLIQKVFWFFFISIFLLPFHSAGMVTDALPVDNGSNYNHSSLQQDELLEDTLFVREFVLALDVIEREPVDIVTSYRMPDARAWCFARIHNSEKMQDLFFEWYYEDTLYFEMSTKVGTSNNWRTYSSVGLQPGTWRVLLKNSKGKVLEEIQFLVSE